MKLAKSRTLRTVAGLTAALALAAGGTAAATGAANHASSRRAAQAAGPDQAALARASLMRYLAESRPFALLTNDGGLKPSSPNLSAGLRGANQADSFNWSGYVDSSTSDTFTAVSGTWREPYTLCTPEQRLTAFWVGLDGFTNSTVEQDGTLAYCFEGAAYYFTWWEMYPAYSVQVGDTVRPGDLISASVTRSGTSYTLALTDRNDPADSFSTVQTCDAMTCLASSAEWIAERPAFDIGITPLSYFSTWSLTNGSQTSDSATGSIADGPDPVQITMIDATSTYPLDIVSGLRQNGSAFTAYWLNSY